MGEKLTIQERVILVFMFYMYFHKNLHGARLLGHPVYSISNANKRPHHSPLNS